jgi:ABC-type iron transport system FetAB ATPase subunit
MSQLRIEQLGVQHVGPIDLNLKPAQIACLSGESGSGKSLILRALADLIPHAGRIWLDDVEMGELSPVQWRRRVAYLPAESQWWLETVADHFHTRDTDLLERFGFDTKAWDWPITRLSSGEKQRLGILRMLQNQPACLLLDEPTASLDQQNTRRVEELVQQYVSAQQAVVLWVSHSPEQIQRIAQQHWRLQEGRLLDDD